MKRLSWLFLISLLSSATFGFTPSAPAAAPSIELAFDSPPSLPSTTLPGIPEIGQNVVCKTVGAAKVCASVSSQYPARYTNVTVYGTLKINGIAQVGKGMKAVWRYKTTTPTCSGITNANGVARCTRYIAGATSGYKVLITITINGYTVTTSFTPQ